MGCDYIIDDEEEHVIINISDYDTDENGNRYSKRVKIPVDKFSENRMNVRVENARPR